jgi:hypothetical protein
VLEDASIPFVFQSPLLSPIENLPAHATAENRDKPAPDPTADNDCTLKRKLWLVCTLSSVNVYILFDKCLHHENSFIHGFVTNKIKCLQKFLT